MPYTIPLQNVPSQSFNIVLDGQYCTISIYRRKKRLYMDLSVEDTAIFTGALCVNMSSVGQFESADFGGVFIFMDTRGDDAPDYEELEDRFELWYYTADEWDEWSDGEKKIVS